MSGIPTEEEFLNEELTSDEQGANHVPLGALELGPADDEPAKDAPAEPPKVEEPAAEPKMVDVRAVQEARAAERQLREELAREREQKARLEERWNMVLQARNAAQEANQPAPPSKEEDILGYYDHKMTTLEQQLQAERQWREQQIQQAQQVNQVQAIVSQADQVYEAARTKHPDVNEAFQFAVEATRKDIAAKGYVGQQAEAAFQQVLLEYAQRCPPDPDQAADFVRRSARWWGWNGPQQATQPAQQAQQNVQALAARTERHMSLSGVSGAEAPRNLDAKSVAQMSDEEFFKLAGTLSEKELDRLMGAA